MIRPFNKDLDFPDSVKTRNRTDVLMNGHRFQADARSTFCNACNLSMVNSFGIAAHYKSGVDIIITGDSTEEQAAYFAWVRHLSRGFGVNQLDKAKGFGTFLKTLDSVAERYFSNLYGEHEILSEHRVTFDIPCDPIFFNIYRDTSYQSGQHWELLTEFLGFKFDKLMFSFSESDCGNPTLMAHLRGLRSEVLLGKGYEAGVKQYSEFAIGLMKKKAFPPELINMILNRYATSTAIKRQRKLAEKYAMDSFKLNTTNLICMIYSPFTQGGKNLINYLREQKIDCAALNIHSALSDESESMTDTCLLLERLSGLTMKNLRYCYNKNLVPSILEKQEIKDPMSLVLRHDPHKAVVQIENGASQEIISGR